MLSAVSRGFSLRARVSLLFLALFCASMALAMAEYAGGSWLHPKASSHSFLENFWCDLLREPAHNGLPNGRAVVLATVGFTALALALAAFWLELADLLPDWRRSLLRVAGPASSLATALVALVPSDRSPSLHGPFVLTAGGLGFACGCVSGAWALRRFARAPAFASATALLLCAAAVNLALYVEVAYFRASDTATLPAVQKVATGLLLTWMVLGLRLSANRPTPRAPLA
jgi:hypothetical protein